MSTGAFEVKFSSPLFKLFSKGTLPINFGQFTRCHLDDNISLFFTNLKTAKKAPYLRSLFIFSVSIALAKRSSPAVSSQLRLSSLDWLRQKH